jgi:hypothetical protein
MADETYPLPSNGWRPGDPSHLSGFHGGFHAELADHGPEAWLGKRSKPMTWPFGWSVGFEPTRLIDPDGNVFAEEGDLLRAGGGLDHEGRFALTMIERWPTSPRTIERSAP